MKFRLIPQTDLIVSEIGFGLWQQSSPWWEKKDDLEMQRLLRQAYDQGINLFDTCDFKGGHEGEALLAKAFPDGLRSKVIVTSYFKFGASSPGPGPAHFSQAPLMNPARVERSCETSLKRMGGSCVDLYFLIDPPAESIRQGEVTQILETLKRKGKIRVGGVLFSPDGNWLDEARIATEDHPVSVLQVVYGLFEQSPGDQFLKLVEGRPEDRKTGCLVRSHDSRNIFGRSLLSSMSNGHCDHNRPCHCLWITRANREMEKIKFLWEGTGRTAAQAAVQFALARSGVCSVLNNFVDQEEMKEQVEAVVLPGLAENEINMIETIWKREIEPRLAEIRDARPEALPVSSRPLSVS